MKNKQSILTQKMVTELMFKGKAIISFDYKWKNNLHHTFLIKQHKTDKNLFFVGVLSVKNSQGSMTMLNTNQMLPQIKKQLNKQRRYHYALTIRRDDDSNNNLRAYITKKSKFDANDNAIKGFLWAFNKMFKEHKNIEDKVSFTHEGFCMKCGKYFPQPESVRTGLWPKCGRRLNTGTRRTRSENEIEEDDTIIKVDMKIEYTVFDISDFN